MIEATELKRGARIVLEGQPWTVDSVHTQSTGARGGQTLVKVRLRNVLTGQVSDRSLRGGDKFPEADLRKLPAQYLYQAPEGDGARFYFMATDSFEQFELTDREVGEDARLLLENLELKAVEYNGNIVGIELPQFVEMVVTEVQPGARGDTASGSVTTAAVTENGLHIQVPLFVKPGDRVRIDSATQQFKDRLAK